MIYEVTIKAPAVNETVMLAAESEEEAKKLAIASALNRMRETAEVTVIRVPLTE